MNLEQLRIKAKLAGRILVGVDAGPLKGPDIILYKNRCHRTPIKGEVWIGELTLQPLRFVGKETNNMYLWEPLE